MKQIESLKKDLEAQYHIDIDEFLEAYESNVKQIDMLTHFNTTPWVLKTISAALNLRMARKYRAGDLNMLLLRDSDDADGELMKKLSKQDDALEQLSTDHVNQHAELLRSRDRVNFLNYYYTAYKLCELLGEAQYLSYFPMLKDREKRIEQDNIWKKICEELNWEFISTI